MMPKWLIRYLVAVYPRRIRERYGDEIAGLLADSNRPVRDLADVARCALTDRITGRPAPIGFRRPTVVKLLVVPVGIHLLNWVPLAILLAGLEALPYSVEVTRLLSGMLAGLVAVLVYRWARRAGRRWAIASRFVVVAVAMTVGLLLAQLVLPIAAGADRFVLRILLWAVPSGATWCIGIIVLNITLAPLLKRVGSWGAGLLLAVGGLAVMELCSIVHVLTVLTVDAAPTRDALSWYPLRLVGYSVGNAFGFNDTTADAARSPETLLTLCTVFALTLMAAGRADRREMVATATA